MAVATELVARHHYARGGSNTRVATHGLWRRGSDECVGCAWWLPPTRACAEKWAGSAWKGVLALSRLVIAPGVPTNACSFLIARSVRLLDPKWHTLVSYADTWRGHTGAIYRAAGWEYAGETKPEPVYTVDGRLRAMKCGPKSRSHAEMLAMGAVYHGRHPKSRWVLRRGVDTLRLVCEDRVC